MNKPEYWVITKGGYFYRPEAKGYTSSLEEAGLFTKESAMESDRHCAEVRVMPYLAALHGKANLRYDNKVRAYWHVGTNEAWPAEACSMEPDMVQHKLRPNRSPDPEGPARFREPSITAAEVREYRDRTGAGMIEAKTLLRRQKYEACMAEFRAAASAEDKLDFILDWITNKEMGR
ncbi:hypothetical protein MAL1_00198 [Bacteriophage DSS3_MAL1]|nr:hypothetical protein MAL1_00198 [Bacteriophage DSS3_MAL1]